MRHNGLRCSRTSGRRTAQARRARPACRATVAPTARRSGRTRRGTGTSDRSAGCGGGRATARRTASGRPRPGLRSRTAGPGTAVRPRTGRSRCSRRFRNAVGGSRRRARPTRPGPRRSQTRCRTAEAPADPWSGPDRDSAVDIAYRTESVARHAACGPEVPKSVTSMATRCANRSASSAQDVPNAAAPRGLPPSIRMSASPASSSEALTGARVGRVQHRGPLVGVVQRERRFRHRPPTVWRLGPRPRRAARPSARRRRDRRITGQRRRSPRHPRRAPEPTPRTDTCQAWRSVSFSIPGPCLAGPGRGS